MFFRNFLKKVTEIFNSREKCSVYRKKQNAIEQNDQFSEKENRYRYLFSETQIRRQDTFRFLFEKSDKNVQKGFPNPDFYGILYITDQMIIL